MTTTEGIRRALTAPPIWRVGRWIAAVALAAAPIVEGPRPAMASASGAAPASSGSASSAPIFAVDAAASVDVVVRDAESPRRWLALEVNPLTLVAIGTWSANVVVVPASHHALVVSPLYTSSTTAGITVFDDNGNPTQLPIQRFRGFGAEIGYRHYAGDRGPRGLFWSPSLLIASMTATAQDASRKHYFDLGLAADAGYQMLVDDDFSLSVGAGLQYRFTTQSIPNQQFPARVFANRGLLPRALVSVGWAF